jgi:hypothetical protein
VVTRATSPVSGQSTRVNAAGFIELVADNVARLDYPLGGAVNGCPALLVEPSAENLVIESEAFNTGWSTQAGATVTPNTIAAPDNNVTADTINLSTTADSNVRQIITSSNSTTYTISCFFKNIALVAGETFRFRVNNANASPNDFIAGAIVDLAAGTATYFQSGTAGTGFSGTGSASIENYGNGWFRVRATFTTGTAGGSATTLVQIIQPSASAARSFYAWGAQVETGSVATSYIPTTTQAITRSNEIMTRTSATALIGQSEGSIYWDIAAVGSVLTGTGNPEFGVRNEVFTNWIGLTSNNPSPFRITAQATVGNLINYQANITSGKAALAWSSAGLVLYVNGVSVATSATNPNFSFSRADIRGATMPFKANAFALYPNRLTDVGLVNITAPDGAFLWGINTPTKLWGTATNENWG